MTIPSIKGTIFCPVADEIRELREQGQISEEELAVELEPEDLELLEQKLVSASWHPIATYARLLDLLCKKQGGGLSQYYEKRGAMSARRLMDAGLYGQLDLLDSIADRRSVGDPEDMGAALRAYRKRLRVVISLAGAIYNVGKWKVVDDEGHPGRVAIDVTESEAYSDGMIGAIVGFLDECARAVSPKIDKLYRFERPEPDRFVVRMLEDLHRIRQLHLGP